MKKRKFGNKMADKKTLPESIFLWCLCVLFIIYTVSLIYPLFWTVINALKTPKEFFKNLYGFPKELTFDGFKTALSIKVSDTTIIGMFFNSVVITFGGLFLALFMCTMTGYIFSKYKFPGSRFVYNMMLVIMMIPLAASTPATYKFLTQTHMYNTRIGVILLYSGGFGYPFLLLYNFFEGVSWSYAEAAMMDGASDFTVFIKIMWPQSLAMQFAIAMMSFMGIFGDFTNPFLYLKGHPTLAVGVKLLSDKMQSGGKWPTTFAALLLTCIPSLFFYSVTNTKMFNLELDTGLKG